MRGIVAELGARRRCHCDMKPSPFSPSAWSPSRASLLAIGIAALCGAAPSALAFDETPQPKIEGAGFELPSGVAPSSLPLRAQSTTIEIAGVLARIHIEQTWENAGD